MLLLCKSSLSWRYQFGIARCIFVDEDTFATLSSEEKRFVIGRELMRIKNDHAIKFRMIAVVSAPAILFNLLLTSYFSRWLDKNADMEASAAFACI